MTNLQRREFLTSVLVSTVGVSAVGSALLPSTTAVAAAIDRLGLADPVRATSAFVRMRCNVEGQWGVWLYSGELIVKPEGEMARKLCRIEGMSFNRATQLESGGYAYDLEECGYWCDSSSGAVLDVLRNPFTGQEVRPAHYRSKQALTFNSLQVSPRPPELPRGIEFQGSITAPVELGGKIFMAEDLFVKTAARAAEGDRPARPVRTQTSMAMFVASSRDLSTPARQFVPADMTYNTMNSFVAWLGMADMLGVQSMRLVARKFQDTRAVPRWLRERLERDQPGFIGSEGRPA